MTIVGDNLWATIGSIVATAVVTYLISRATRNFDARGQAEAALIGIGPKIIEEQNRRISDLSAENARMWTIVQEHRTEIIRLSAIEAQCQNDLRQALARIARLEAQ